MKPETPPHLLQTGRAVGLVDTQDMGGVISVAWRPRRDHDYVLADIVAAQVDRMALQLHEDLYEPSIGDEGVLMVRPSPANRARRLQGIIVPTRVRATAASEDGLLVQVACEHLGRAPRLELFHLVQAAVEG